MKTSRPAVAAAAAALLTWGGLGWAQHEHRMQMPKDPTIEIVESKEGVVSIPFKLDSNHLILPVRIKGSTFQVILDTGMPMSGIMLYGTEAVEKLNLAYGPQQIQVGGAGGSGRPVDARLAEGVDIAIGGVRLNGATAIVMPPLSHFHGTHDGVIGYGVFKNFVVRIDNDRNVVELRDAKSFVAPESSGVVPLEFVNNFPYANIVVTTDGGKKTPLTVVVDLGAGHPISLNVDEGSKISVPPNAIRATIGKGVGGTVVGRVGRVSALELGGHTLTDVVATFPDRGHQSPGGLNSRNGNLGNGVLRHFNVTFDYSRNVMLLQKNERSDQPFEWDMSGMRLVPSESTGLLIEAIVDGSPAAKAGLAVADIVTHIDGKPVSKNDLYALRRSLERNGAAIKVSATRNGKPLEVTLTLRRMV